ncbi:MAG: PEGA domain-containing protein, partial [Leptospiraceae bacterium]|nr:PEGA domain-containing protein [Leptospiraceae bacterium]
EKSPLIETKIYPFRSRVIKSNLPTSISLQKRLILEKSISVENAMLEGAKDQCIYVILGEYEVLQGEDKLKIKVYITNRITGQLSKIEKETSLRRAFQEIEASSLDLKKALSPLGLSGLEIQTDEKEVTIFIDDIYYGTTPFKREDLVPGKHKISLEKNGFEKINLYVVLEKDKIQTFQAKLKKTLERFGYLTINSDPQVAEVYLGNQFLGKTPLDNTKVKVGRNRLRISLENYIEEFQAVDIEPEKTISLNLKLKEGNTKEYYKTRLNIFQDYTYFDFSLFSLYGSLIFYSTYMYADYRISRDRDRLYAVTIWNELNTFNQIQNFSNNTNSINFQTSFTLELLYQQSQINQTEKNISTYKAIQNFSIAGVVGMLVSSVVFYKLGINSEAIEFGYLPKTIGQQQEEAFFSVRFRWD